MLSDEGNRTYKDQHHPQVKDSKDSKNGKKRDIAHYPLKYGNMTLPGSHLL